MVEFPAFQSSSSPGLTTADTQPLSLHTQEDERTHKLLHLHVINSPVHADECRTRQLPKKTHQLLEIFCQWKILTFRKTKMELK